VRDFKTTPHFLDDETGKNFRLIFEKYGICWYQDGMFTLQKENRRMLKRDSLMKCENPHRSQNNFKEMKSSLQGLVTMATTVDQNSV
jgi:hypothetical protein